MAVNYNDGKWHGWNGGECPVHPETVVEVATETLRPFKMEARSINWKHSNDPNLNKIIAFRVVKEHKEPREFQVVYNEDKTVTLLGSPVDHFYAKPGEIIHVREVIE